jgi:hypothetical protein
METIDNYCRELCSMGGCVDKYTDFTDNRIIQRK